MPTLSLEERLTTLESRVDALSTEKAVHSSKSPWWEQWFGKFKDDPTFDEAVRLGAEYRKNQPNAADSPDAIGL